MHGLAFFYSQKLPTESGGVKEVLLKGNSPKTTSLELGVLQTPYHII